MKKGFTLLELLVVIAIIGMLVAMTIPILSKGFGAGRDALCKSNLRTIGTAFFGYTADHTIHPMAWGLPSDDYVPPSMEWYEARWEYQLLPYTKGMEGKIAFNDVPSRLRAMSEGVFRCPEFPYGKTVYLDDGGSLPADQVRISYAMNYWLTGPMKDTDPFERVAWSPSVVPSPSKMLMFVDVLNAPMMHVKSRFESSLLRDRVHYRHGDHANLAYYDTSVRNFTKEEGNQLAQDPDFVYKPDSTVYLSRRER